jgi:hypothetical protein
MEIFERIRYARDEALEAERRERRRLAEADNADLQRAASVRLATRQAVREALDDVLDEKSDPEAELDSAAAGRRVTRAN